jgi:hypothetical protein
MSDLVKTSNCFQPIKMRALTRAHSYGRPQRETSRTLSRLLSHLINYVKTLPSKDEELSEAPAKITPRRLKLAFRRANGSERLAA